MASVYAFRAVRGTFLRELVEREGEFEDESDVGVRGAPRRDARFDGARAALHARVAARAGGEPAPVEVVLVEAEDDDAHDAGSALRPPPPRRAPARRRRGAHAHS